MATDPPGATVFMDGDYRGTTPLDIGELTPGDHRVTLVKGGYLENLRIVSIPPGVAQSIRVRLTPYVRRPHPPAQQEETPETGKVEATGSGKTKVLIGLGILAAGAGGYLALRNTNRPPTPGMVVVTPPDTGLVAVTSFTFNAVGASDPDNDPLTFTWNFGDGASASGTSATHTYGAEGTFSVTVSISDGEVMATASASVLVRSLSGTWDFLYRGSEGDTVTLNQNGAAVTGTWNDDGPRATLSGAVSAPRNIEFRFVSPFNLATFTFTGTANPALTQFSGTLSGSNGYASSSSITRR